MVFSFFKKPPEKMVARPAAAPRPREGEAPAGSVGTGSMPAGLPPQNVPGATAPAPAAEDKKEDLPALDFTDFSGSFVSSFGEIHVENDIDPIESDIEQVAVLYANAQDDMVKALLENAVLVHHFGPGERLWLMLFDFYRLKGLQAPFEALSLDYAKAFEKSPPTWRTEQAKVAAKPTAVPSGTVIFKGSITGENDEAFAALEQAVAKNPKLRVELSRVKSVDSLGAERMLGVLSFAAKKKHEVELVGRDALAALLESKIETGRPEDSGCWLLLIELYQLMGKQEAFEEMAINYAVTFEMSPPSWEPKRVAAAESPSVLPAVPEAEPEQSFYTPRGDLKAARFPDLPAYAESHDPVILDFSGVTRIDFVSAGTLVNLLTPAKRLGKRIVIRHPNCLVAELLGVVGLKSVAEVELLKN